MATQRKKGSDRIVFDAEEEQMPFEAKLNIWMKRYGMMNSSCEGITVKHLLTTCFRDHLPDHLRGKGSIAKITALLKKVSWILVYDYHGEAAFCYSDNLFVMKPDDQSKKRKQQQQLPESQQVDTKSDDNSNKRKQQQQFPPTPKQIRGEKSDDEAFDDGHSDNMAHDRAKAAVCLLAKELHLWMKKME